MKVCPTCPTPKKCMSMGKCLKSVMGKPSTLKEDPVYKKSGGKIYNCR